MRIPETTTTLPAFQRGEKIEVTVNGQRVTAFAGELVSTVLHANGQFIFAHKTTTGRASGLYCGMGVCYECLVTINGEKNVRACQMYVVDQMDIQTAAGP
jgi:aerobic-type carbon monoxide dehydrogenase small subunit (CoxS/CutS family)